MAPNQGPLLKPNTGTSPSPTLSTQTEPISQPEEEYIHDYWLKG